MGSVWLWVLICALIVLAMMAIRSKLRLKWIGYAFIHLLIAAVFLYLINVLGILGDFYIPINVMTVAVITILGLPGLTLLVGLKWLLF